MSEARGAALGRGLWCWLTVAQSQGTDMPADTVGGVRGVVVEEWGIFSAETTGLAQVQAEREGGGRERGCGGRGCEG